ncbi:type IX secretion system protein PorQ [Geofilum rubicundum]|uniref:type IX secretion system protein PorQ n=1 Tax=Geofilum rubicundum TaxID=472113 RepID=UPI001D0EAE44|nr:type IX secretion system protein PorQ [Geofilum rubicundum]
MKNIHKYFFTILLVALSYSGQAQRGGESTFGLLHLTQSAKMASLGGNQVGLAGNDLAMLLHNPAILDSSFSQQVSMSYVPYMADISYGFGGIAWHFDQAGTFALGFHHIGHGDFIAAEESGLITGSFTAGESMVQLSYSRPLSPRLTAGLSIKPVFSRIEAYHSWGIATDLGLFYKSMDQLFQAGITLRNYGRQLTAYDNAPLETLPADLQVGLSQKLEHAPFRFSLTAQDLFSGSLQYTLPESEQGASNTFLEEDNTFEKVARHLAIGVEFVPSGNFYVAGGINPRRRAELKMANKPSTVGFTWGFGIKIYKFNFSYGSGRYHLGGTSNHFSITTNLSAF